MYCESKGLHTAVARARESTRKGMHVATAWRRPIGCLIFIRHFPQKSPIFSGSFVKIDLLLRAFYGSWPSCMLQGNVVQARQCCECGNRTRNEMRTHVLLE